MLNSSSQITLPRLKHGITSIDHPVIAVANMDAAKKQFQHLGFIVPPRGSHVEWGTGNWCIMFSNDYLELRGINDATRPLMGLDDILNKFGEGLMGVAFGTDNAADSHTLLIESGIKVSELTTLTRNFERVEGWTKPEFELCFPDKAAVEGLRHTVLCEHKTPELIRDTQFLKHPNGAIGVTEIVGCIDNIDVVEALQRNFLGEDNVKRLDNEIILTISQTQLVRLMDRENYLSTYFKTIETEFPKLPFLGAIQLEVQNIQNTKSYFDHVGVKYSVVQDSGAIRTFPQISCGVILEFIES